MRIGAENDNKSPSKLDQLGNSTQGWSGDRLEQHPWTQFVFAAFITEFDGTFTN